MLRQPTARLLLPLVATFSCTPPNNRLSADLTDRLIFFGVGYSLQQLRCAITSCSAITICNGAKVFAQSRQSALSRLSSTVSSSCLDARAIAAFNLR
jgi:hypothetical protein